MRCTDVIDVIIVTRRHVGGIPVVNTTLVKMRKSKYSYAMVIRRLFTFPTQHSLQAYVKITTFRRCNKYTSNMAAVTVVDRITSLCGVGSSPGSTHFTFPFPSSPPPQHFHKFYCLANKFHCLKSGPFSPLVSQVSIPVKVTRGH